MKGYKFDYESKVWGGETLRLSPIHFRAARLGQALKALENVKGRVLDVGCGAGDFCEAIKFYRPDLEIFGIDLSQKAIKVAKKRVQKAVFKVADAQELPFKDDYFDAVVCFDLIEHVEFPQKVLGEIYRVLKPGGIFHGHIPVENNFWSLEGMLIRLGWKGKEIYGGHPHHFSLKEVKEMFRKEKFKIIRYCFGDHLFHQLLEIGYFTWLALRRKNLGYTVEGYLGLAKPDFRTRLLRIFKNILALVSNSESRVFWWYPGIGVHVTAIKK